MAAQRKKVPILRTALTVDASLVARQFDCMELLEPDADNMRPTSGGH
jgi:hypothetical protein